MIFAELSAEGWVLIIVAAGSIATSLYTLNIGARDRKRQDAREDAKIERDRLAAEKVEAVRLQARDAAVKVDDVKVTLKEANDATTVKLDSIAEVGLRTEKYCNSAMGRALRMTAGTARAKADITHDPVDIVAADLAERESGDHEKKQSEMDSAKPVQ